ncbi:Transthyretin-like family protein [Ancylostoma caninum]|uniref:Transthyretin-like family protein n=1 Tax=Ancylostoma caninum TaxID=29170 RepID=A0A368FIT4_ANCCA|nr:Transthyretin-like family protein [Ancylostoma caninum]
MAVASTKGPKVEEFKDFREVKGGGSPVVYEEEVVDASGTFFVKAEILNGGVWNPGTPYGYLSLTINHNCQGQRQMVVELPTSYFNQGIGEIKTFDLGIINLEGRFPCEGTSNFV